MNQTISFIFAGLVALSTTAAKSDFDEPYAVGSTTRFYHDESRPFDSVAGVDSGVRVLLTEIWYPVARENIRADSTRATYGDYVFGDREMHYRMMTRMVTPPLTPENVRTGVSQAQIDSAIENHFNEQRGSYVDVPPASQTGGFPVVVMSHGDGGTRYNMQSTAEYLAAHGYMVIAPEHAGNASFVLTGRDPALRVDPKFARQMAAVMALHDDRGAYGAPENSGQSLPRNESGTLNVEVLQVLDSLLLQRVNDLRKILDLLPDINGNGFFKGVINETQTGVMGRSFGGATTLAALGLEPRFNAGVAIVAPSVPDFRSQIPPEFLLPPQQESVMFSAGPKFPLANFTKPVFLLNSSEDALIININFGLSMAFDNQPPKASNPHPQIRQAFENSNTTVAWGIFEDGNHGTLSVSGAYWWPDLRIGQFPRYFDPEVKYTLTPAELAHQIQAEKVRQFFDLTLQGRQDTRNTFLQNPWESRGFSLEVRNLD